MNRIALSSSHSIFLNPSENLQKSVESMLDLGNRGLGVVYQLKCDLESNSLQHFDTIKQYLCYYCNLYKKGLEEISALLSIKKSSNKRFRVNDPFKDEVIKDVADVILLAKGTFRAYLCSMQQLALTVVDNKKSDMSSEKFTQVSYSVTNIGYLINRISRHCEDLCENLLFKNQPFVISLKTSIKPLIDKIDAYLGQENRDFNSLCLEGMQKGMQDALDLLKGKKAKRGKEFQLTITRENKCSREDYLRNCRDWLSHCYKSICSDKRNNSETKDQTYDQLLRAKACIDRLIPIHKIREKLEGNFFAKLQQEQWPSEENCDLTSLIKKVCDLFLILEPIVSSNESCAIHEEPQTFVEMPKFAIKNSVEYIKKASIYLKEFSRLASQKIKQLQSEVEYEAIISCVKFLHNKLTYLYLELVRASNFEKKEFFSQLKIEIKKLLPALQRENLAKVNCKALNQKIAQIKLGIERFNKSCYYSDLPKPPAQPIEENIENSLAEIKQQASQLIAVNLFTADSMENNLQFIYGRLNTIQTKLSVLEKHKQKQELFLQLRIRIKNLVASLQNLTKVDCIALSQEVDKIKRIIELIKKEYYPFTSPELPVQPIEVNIENLLAEIKQQARQLNAVENGLSKINFTDRPIMIAALGAIDKHLSTIQTTLPVLEKQKQELFLQLRIGIRNFVASLQNLTEVDCIALSQEVDKIKWIIELIKKGYYPFTSPELPVQPIEANIENLLAEIIHRKSLLFAVERGLTNIKFSEREEMTNALQEIYTYLSTIQTTLPVLEKQKQESLLPLRAEIRELVASIQKGNLTKHDLSNLNEGINKIISKMIIFMEKYGYTFALPELEIPLLDVTQANTENLLAKIKQQAEDRLSLEEERLTNIEFSEREEMTKALQAIYTHLNRIQSDINRLLGSFFL